MNELEKALLDPSDDLLSFYLEIELTADIRRDIEEIRKNAALSTDAGRLRERVLAALQESSDE